MKQVFYRERANGYYGVAAYILSNFLSSFPFLVAIAATTGTITFNMVKFRPGFMHFLFFTLNIFSCIAVIESLMMVVASLVPNFLMGIITGAGIIVRTKASTLDEFVFLQTNPFISVENFNLNLTSCYIFHSWLFTQGIMMMTSGFFRLLSDLPKPVWRYPISYVSYGSWAIQVH